MAGTAKKDRREWRCIATYDFAIHGGAIGTIDLKAGLSKGCVVSGGYMRVLTALAGGGASAAVQLEAAGDIQAAAVVSGAPWSTTGLKALTVLPQTVATYIETTVDRNLSLVISGGALTAGKFEIYLWVGQLLNILS